MPLPIVIGAAPAAALTTVIGTAAAAVAKFAVSDGVNVTVSRCAGPGGSSVPAGGVYTKVPGGLATVAFNWDGPSTVPETMIAGAAQLMIGVAFNTVNGTVVIEGANAVSAGVNVTVKVREPST